MNNSDRPGRDDCAESTEKWSDDTERSNVVAIGSLREETGRKPANLREIGATHVISIWKAVSPGIVHVFDTFDELGIDTEPLGRRMLEEDDPDVLQIIIHMREFTATILRAVELRVDNGVQAIHVHPQQSMSRTALDFAERLAKGDDDSLRRKLIKLYEWLGNEEANAKVLVDYINRCK